MLDSINAEQSPSPAPAPPADAPNGEALRPSSEPNDQEPGEDRHWWQRFLHTRGHQSDIDAASSAETEDGHEPIAPAQKLVTLSEDELNQRVYRQAQSLRDRAELRRQQEAQETERKRLREEDPWQYAQTEKEREDLERVRLQQTEQMMGLLTNTAKQFDAHTIDPIVNALPEKERKRILELPNAGQGLPGRRVIVDEALKTYGRLEYERGVRETQAKLKKDPTFRKSVLADLRGSYQDPELYPGNGAPSDSGLDSDNVSNILRRQYQQR